MKKLHDIFTTVDELENHEALFNLFYIYKYMLSLGDTKLIEVLLSKEFFMDTLGALECKSYLHS